MRHLASKHIVPIAAAAALAFTVVYAQAPSPPAAQGPAGPGAPGGGARGGGRGGGLPGATPEQTAAVMEMVTGLTPLSTAVTTARTELATITFADARNDAGVRAATDKLRAAQLALATARAAAFATLQAGANKLNAEQVTAFIAAGGQAGRGGGRGPGGPGAGAPPAGPGRGN